MRLGTFLILGPGLVRCAINLDGTLAVAPAAENDFSPISDPTTYYPDQHDCPLPCLDYSNMHSWIPYFSVDRLRRCQDPMLLQFSVSQSLDDPTTTILIRSCSLGEADGQNETISHAMDNPKKAQYLFQGPLDTAPACAVGGVESPSAVEILQSRETKADASEASILLRGMQNFFRTADNCNENFLFAYHRQSVIGAYIGSHLGKSSIRSVLEALIQQVKTAGSVSTHVVAQLCGGDRTPDQSLGVFLQPARDLADVQRAALEWSRGICVKNKDLEQRQELAGIKVFEIPRRVRSFNQKDDSVGANITLKIKRTSAQAWLPKRASFKASQLIKRATCRYIEVLSGNGCADLVTRCGIPVSDFYKYNPKPNLCGSLMIKDYICCSPGDPYTVPKPATPKQNSDGSCASHLIMNGDSCDFLARKYGVTINDLERWNKGKTWGWTECKKSMMGYNMCVSDGAPPLPAPQKGTECGPLVPGTLRPTDKSISVADLNPCPLKACCSNFGFCGPFPSHCDIHKPKDGGPGTVEAPHVTSCVSNCDTTLKRNSGPPAAFQRIGYYAAFGLERDCLWLKAKNANTDGTYTHMHWAFADIDPKTWKPILKDPKQQWADFKALSNVKRILSFGGWAYSTEPATFNIIRSAIINNRKAFASNLAQFVKDEGIDGIDIDWEYPGVGSTSTTNFQKFY